MNETETSRFPATPLGLHGVRSDVSALASRAQGNAVHAHRHALEFLRLIRPAKLDQFPDFLVIAPPKTGTTWLANQLRAHEGIFVPPAKEIKYFNYFWKSRNLAWYLSIFRE